MRTLSRSQKQALRAIESKKVNEMNPKFELEPKIGVGPVKLGATRSSAQESMGLECDSFMKTPLSKHPTDAYYQSGFQIFYEGEEPKVECIELSRGCNFEATLSLDSAVFSF